MRSKWQVTSQFFGDVKKFAVYRLLDVAEVDHSGNREFAGGYVDSKERAQAIADALNDQESPKGGENND